tara:strand:+ start:73 stop:225 length:153 start_codon:yes stop_codon:yes gene_type:complete
MEDKKIEKRREYMRKYYIKRKDLGYITVKNKQEKLSSLKVERGKFIVNFD